MPKYYLHESLSGFISATKLPNIARIWRDQGYNVQTLISEPALKPLVWKYGPEGRTARAVFSHYSIEEAPGQFKVFWNQTLLIIETDLDKAMDFANGDHHRRIGKFITWKHH